MSILNVVAIKSGLKVHFFSLLRSIYMLSITFVEMNIFLTYDYELFFGAATGSVEKCMLEPTNALQKIADRFSIPMTFFVDIGYLIKLEEFAPSNPSLQKDLEKVKAQLHELQTKGHSLQIHIHPHWEKSIFEDGKWKIETKNAYKLADFSDDEIERIVRSYTAYLNQLTGKKAQVFRAGGWCIQPFNRLEKVFKELEIRIDSSVFSGGYFEAGEYSFDFRTAPKKSNYRFSDDVCVEDESGYFTEYPISSHVYSPLFYWRLYGLGRLFPAQHKMIGDGTFLAQPGRKKSVLTSFTHNHVSCDGYYASKLTTCLNKHRSANATDFVVIGHPKGLTQFSLKALERFVAKNYTKHTFKALTEVL